jgi:hypothetical protein
MVNFFLPDFYFNCKMNKITLKYQEEHPEWFNDGCNIVGFYGVYPATVWNGEYYVIGGADNENIKATTKEFNDKGKAIIHEFTNSELQPYHIYDNIGNIHLRLTENELNMVCVTTDLLKDYIEEAYPKFSFISSSAKHLYEIEDLQTELKDDSFKYVIANTIFNNDDQLFDLENKDKIIMVINDAHKFSCPNDAARCKFNSEVQLNYGVAAEQSPCNGCEAFTVSFYELMNRKHFITVDDVYSKYPENGINNFYVAGRAANKLDLLEAYVYYLIKPEWQDYVRLKAMMELE